MNILIKNNITFALENYIDGDTLYFNPDINSDIQYEYFSRIYNSLKSNYNTVFNKELDHYDKIFCWRAHNELTKYSSICGENYLFDLSQSEIDTFPEGFSSFRRKYEHFLPSSFEDAVEPQIDSVKLKIDNYFNSLSPSTYFDTRNQLLGENYSTRFSNLLSLGLVDVKYLYNRVRQYEGEVIKNKSTGWIVFELLWREYFYWHYQKHTTSYFSKNGLVGRPDFTDFDIDFTYLLEESHPFMKAACNELFKTGFLSNRSRQLFASYFLNEWRLDWRVGAKLFEKYLLDYDVFSNYGNWMYLAGVGVDPRGKRVFNIDKQLKTYDSKGEYLHRFL